ncbi:MAG: spore coat U domain-containing protein [Geobacteraceae bacterium]
MRNLVGFALFFSVLFISAASFGFTCRISTTPVNFGNYDVFSPFVLDSTGTVNVSCNNLDKWPLSIKVTLSVGNSGRFNPREMKATSGQDRLKYYLFSDPSMTVVWGDGTGGSSYVPATVTRNSTFNALIYGRVPPGQNVSVGEYSDVLTATVIW